MRWILLLVSIIGFALTFSAKSAGVMGFGFLLGVIGLIAALFAFAAVRIAANTRPDAVLLTDKDVSALRSSLRKASSATSSAPDTAASSGFAAPHDG